MPRKLRAGKEADTTDRLTPTDILTDTVGRGSASRAPVREPERPARGHSQPDTRRTRGSHRTRASGLSGPVTSCPAPPRCPPPPALRSAARGLPGRELHSGRARAAERPLHEPRPARVRADQPAGDGQGRAVRPLLALSRHAAAAVPRRVRRRPPRHGAGRTLGRRRGRARGAAVRADLPRLRRRLGGPARRRPRGLRVGLQRADQGPAAPPAGRLSRAVHALHRLRRADARAARRVPLLPRPGAGPGLRAGDGRAVRDLLGLAAASQRMGRDASFRAGTARTRPPMRGRSRPRRSTCCAACCRRARSRTWASSPPARRTSS